MELTLSELVITSGGGALCSTDSHSHRNGKGWKFSCSKVLLSIVSLGPRGGKGSSFWLPVNHMEPFRDFVMVISELQHETNSFNDD